MTELTVLQAKLISSWLEVERSKKMLAKCHHAFEKNFEKQLSQAIDNYFIIWFELNREKLENKRIENRIERGDSEEEAILSVSSHQFQEYARERCVEGLDL